MKNVVTLLRFLLATLYISAMIIVVLLLVQGILSGLDLLLKL